MGVEMMTSLSQHAFRAQRRRAAVVRREAEVVALRGRLERAEVEVRCWRQWWWGRPREQATQEDQSVKSKDAEFCMQWGELYEGTESSAQGADDCKGAVLEGEFGQVEVCEVCEARGADDATDSDDGDELTDVYESVGHESVGYESEEVGEACAGASCAPQEVSEETLQKYKEIVPYEWWITEGDGGEGSRHDTEALRRLLSRDADELPNVGKDARSRASNAQSHRRNLKWLVLNLLGDDREDEEVGLELGRADAILSVGDNMMTVFNMTRPDDSGEDAVARARCVAFVLCSEGVWSAPEGFAEDQTKQGYLVQMIGKRYQIQFLKAQLLEEGKG